MYNVLNSSTKASDSPNNSLADDTAGQPVQGPLFFNYHEFAETFYIDIQSDGQFHEHDEDHCIYMTHFPNIYVPQDSQEFNTTRIVRIPRRFDTTLETLCFSTCLPGTEPAAFINPEDAQRFVARGIYDNGQLFGRSSTSPLSQYLSQYEFEQIITPINEILSQTTATFTWYNLIDLLLDILTLGVWHLISRYLVADPLLRLETYVAEVNELPLLRDNKIKIISPRRSGYLSVCYKTHSKSYD
ncbi:hypothetical protein HG537_0E02160 [Torulaspora globosa]|uniref:Ras modification protein ERF4 n=1 Tax=Torulaspora globosa TaxID=48254 RepID=A0A7H9HU48_9SACH|nr:hypothetical protein HG537_0E02160 [Torulaspora sp. CBS 2947]